MEERPIAAYRKVGIMASKTKSGKRSELDTYMELIHRLPLKPIKDDNQHEAATEMIGRLIGHTHDDGANDSLDTLILLVNKYEDENHTPQGLDLSPKRP